MRVRGRYLVGKVDDWLVFWSAVKAVSVVRSQLIHE